MKRLLIVIAVVLGLALLWKMFNPPPKPSMPPPPKWIEDVAQELRKKSQATTELPPQTMVELALKSSSIPFVQRSLEQIPEGTPGRGRVYDHLRDLLNKLPKDSAIAEASGYGVPPTPVPRSERQRFASDLEQALLDLGYDTTCTVSGKQSEVLTITGYLVTRVFANDFLKRDDGKWRVLVHNLQFKKVAFRSKAGDGAWDADNP